MNDLMNLPFELDPQPEGGWTITCPILPGLITEADTFDEIGPNVTDAFRALTAAYDHLKKPLPYIAKEVAPK